MHKACTAFSRVSMALAAAVLLQAGPVFAQGASVQSLQELHQQLQAELAAMQQEEQLVRQKLTAFSKTTTSASAPAATSSVAPTASTTGSTPITDAQGASWAITPQGTATVNGQKAPFTAEVTKLVAINGVVYQGTSFGGWWAWNGTDWVAVSGDPSQGPVTVTGLSEFDQGAASFSLSPTGQVLMSGQPSDGAPTAVKIVSLNHQMYIETASGNWLVWDGSAWQSVTQQQTISRLAAINCNPDAISHCFTTASVSAQVNGATATATGTTAASIPSAPSTGGGTSGTVTTPSSNTTTGAGSTPAAGGSSGAASATGTGGSTTGNASTATPSNPGTGTTVGTAITCAAGMSASGTTIPSAAAITDCSGNLWTLDDGLTEINQNPVGNLSDNATLLLEYTGNLYMEDSALTWWMWSSDNTGWVPISADPRTTANSASGGNAACGSAGNQSTTTAPTANLCSSGTPTLVSGTGPWTWSCAGSNGGTAARCIAVPPGAGNGATFSDNFDSFNPSLWYYNSFDEGGDSLWTNDPSITPLIYKYSDGKVNMGLMPTPAGSGISKPYVSGIMDTYNSGHFAQHYGYFEVTVAVDKFIGLIYECSQLSPYHFPPVMLTRIYTDSGNVQHVEFYTDQVLRSTSSAEGFDASAYHTYGFNWTPDGIEVYIDRVLFTSEPNPGGNWDTDPVYTKMNVNTGWLNTPDPANPGALPAYAHVDSYNVWASKPF